MPTLIAFITSRWRVVAAGVWAIAVVLIRWFITTDPADPKTLALLLSPALPLIARRRPGSGRDEAAGSRFGSIGPLAFAFLIVYTIINWSLQSYPYYGNRAMVFAWQCFVAFALGALFLTHTDWRRWLAPSLVLALCLASLYAVLEYLGYVPGADRGFPPMVTGLVGHKNTLGFMLMVTLIMTVSWMVNRETGRGLVAGLGAVIVQMIALVLARSRGSLGLALVGILVVVLEAFIRTGRFSRPRSRYILYLCLLVTGLLPVLLWSEGMWKKVALLVYPGRAFPAAREVFYAAQWKLFLSNPLFGVGPGNFISLNIPLWPSSMRMRSAPDFLALNGHCDYLEALSELGLVGFIPFLTLWAGALWLGFRQARRSGRSLDFALAVALLVMMVHASFSTASRHLPASALLWLTMGYFWRHWFRRRRERMNRRTRRYTAVGAGAFHIIVLALFAQIIIADAYHIRSKRVSGGEGMTPGEAIEKALRVFPAHPNALRRAAHLAIAAGELDFARTCADRLDSLAPHIHPTAYIRGVCAFEEGNYTRALAYANEQLRLKPRFFDPLVLRAEALAKLARCEELQRSQRVIRRKIEALEPSITTAEAFERRYLELVDPVHAALAGPLLRGILAAKIDKKVKRYERRLRLAGDALEARCAAHESEASRSHPPAPRGEDETRSGP
jgi:O-antigen ligase